MKRVASETLGACEATWQWNWFVERERKKNQIIVNDEFPFLSFPGEPFSQEEMEEMLSAAIDPETNAINYKEYITTMVIDDS